MKGKLPVGSDWTFKKLEEHDKVISDYAKDWLKLDTYENQIEVISSEQMLDAYASNGMPVFYNPWSFGKKFIEQQKAYKSGQMGLAYEIVINSDPCISYLMEENSMPMQSLVIAHACYGHNAVFKNNYLFRERTRAQDIVNYLIFAKNYIKECEEKYGSKEVESFLDSCHTLMNHGFNKHTRHDQDKEQKILLEIENAAFLQKNANELWDKTIPNKIKESNLNEKVKFPSEPQENLLYFFEKNSPYLEGWQRELLRIVRKKSEYFYPQMQTKTINEGFATFTHYNLMNKLFDDDWVDEGFITEILRSHCNVLYQPDFDSQNYSGFNPYALGFAIFNDIKRMCLTPTKEDEKFFPDIVGKNWVDITNDVMENYRDDNFVLQFMSPKVMRDFSLFSLERNAKEDHLLITDIHDDDGYRNVKRHLSESLDVNLKIPNLEVVDVDVYGDRKLTIRHTAYNDVMLHDSTVIKTLPHISNLWGFDVNLISVSSADGRALKNYFYDATQKRVLIDGE